MDPKDRVVSPVHRVLRARMDLMVLQENKALQVP